MSKSRIISIALLLGVLFLGSFSNLLAQAPQGPPSTGARELLQSFSRAMTVSDLVLLKDGGALSGTVHGDQFSITLSSGQTETLSRSNIAFMSFGDKTDNLVLLSGDLLSGLVQIDNFSITLPIANGATIPKTQIATIIFKFNLSGGGQGAPNRQLFRVLQGLQSQNIFALFAKSLTSYDLAIFPNQQLLSGTLVNQQIVFNSALFGKLTFKASDVAEIDLAPPGSSSVDFITLKTNDRISGALDDQSPVRFQPVAVTDAQGQKVTLTFKRGDVSKVAFRLPASAFGSGGPGFQGGPGR